MERHYFLFDIGKSKNNEKLCYTDYYTKVVKLKWIVGIIGHVTKRWEIYIDFNYQKNLWDLATIIFKKQVFYG